MNYQAVKPNYSDSGRLVDIENQLNECKLHTAELSANLDEIRQKRDDKNDEPGQTDVFTSSENAKVLDSHFSNQNH